MAKKGTKIPDLTKGRVREQLADETDPEAIKRLTVAHEYLEGLPAGDIETKYGWDRQTVYNWLDRFEERGNSKRSVANSTGVSRRTVGRIEQRREIYENFSD